MTNTRITDPEILERRYPVVLREFSLRPGSGGAGRWHGGNGVIREVTCAPCWAGPYLQLQLNITPGCAAEMVCSPLWQRDMHDVACLMCGCVEDKLAYPRATT